jgi:hypothetical protein
MSAINAGDPDHDMEDVNAWETVTEESDSAEDGGQEMEDIFSEEDRWLLEAARFIDEDPDDAEEEDPNQAEV